MQILDLDTHPTSYVSVADLAEYWEVSRQRIYKHIEDGLLPALRLGPRCFRVNTKAAVAFERMLSTRGMGFSVKPPKPRPVRPPLNLLTKKR